MTTLEALMKEFEEKFRIGDFDSRYSNTIDYDEIKSFLTKVYRQVRQEAIEECIEVVRDESNMSLVELNNAFADRRTIISAISSLKDKGK